jgi:hypothetical protein
MRKDIDSEMMSTLLRQMSFFMKVPSGQINLVSLLHTCHSFFYPAARRIWGTKTMKAENLLALLLGVSVSHTGGSGQGEDSFTHHSTIIQVG